MKKYTMWRLDDKEWLLEVEDDTLNNWIKANTDLKVERFAVGINLPLRAFKVKDENVDEVEQKIDAYVKRKKNG
jgi:hypothetical protein